VPLLHPCRFVNVRLPVYEIDRSTAAIHLIGELPFDQIIGFAIERGGLRPVIVQRR